VFVPACYKEQQQQQQQASSSRMMKRQTSEKHKKRSFHQSLSVDVQAINDATIRILNNYASTMGF